MIAKPSVSDYLLLLQQSQLSEITAIRLKAEWTLSTCLWWKKLDCLIKCQRLEWGWGTCCWLQIKISSTARKSPLKGQIFVWSGIEGIFFSPAWLRFWRRFCRRDAKPSYHTLFILIRLSWVTLLSLSDLQILLPRTLFTLSLSALSSLRSAVLSCRFTICSVEVMFLVMFMHKSQPLCCHSACLWLNFMLWAEDLNSQLWSGADHFWLCFLF